MAGPGADNEANASASVAPSKAARVDAAPASFREALRSAAVAAVSSAEGSLEAAEENDHDMPPPSRKPRQFVARQLLPTATANSIAAAMPKPPPAKSPPAATVPSAAPEGMACALCGGRDDDGVCERLMFVEPGCWVHLNCAYWSSDTHETPSGAIVSVPSAVKRARKLPCAKCGKPGASLGCNTGRCQHSYHFACAVTSDVQLMIDKRLYCPEHKHTKQAMKGAVWDAHTPIARPLTIQPSKRFSAATGFTLPPAHWIRVGALTVVSCGTPPPKRSEPPEGFLAFRTHWSAVHSGRRCGYMLAVREAADGPSVDAEEDDEPPPRELTFEIVCEDAPDDPIIKPSAARAVRALYARLYAAQPAAAAVSAAFPYEPGYFFGWLHTPVQTRLHGDPNQPAKAKAAALPVNPSGCARTEPFRRLAAQTAYGGRAADAAAASGSGSGKRRMRDEDDGQLRGASGPEYLSREQLPPGNVEKLRGLNSEARTRFKVARSAIHGWVRST
jgi:hypothetical protein